MAFYRGERSPNEPTFRPARTSILPPGWDRVTYILIGINIVVHLVDTVAGYFGTYRPLANAGANAGLWVAQGEYYRLFTSIFLHANLQHLLMNALGIFILGNIVETLIGWRRFLLLYIVAGLVGSAASLYFHPIGASVGASGAVLGLLGYILYVRWQRPYAIPPQMQQWAMSLLLLNLLFSFLPGIDRWAHLGGIVGGFVGGFIVGLPGVRRSWGQSAEPERSLLPALLGLLAVIAAIILSILSVL